MPMSLWFVDMNQRVKNPRVSSWSCPVAAASAMVPPVVLRLFAMRSGPFARDGAAEIGVTLVPCGADGNARAAAGRKNIQLAEFVAGAAAPDARIGGPRGDWPECD